MNITPHIFDGYDGLIKILYPFSSEKTKSLQHRSGYSRIRESDQRRLYTADWTRLPYNLLACISNHIFNEVSGVNRVVYDISSKPLATIEWE